MSLPLRRGTPVALLSWLIVFVLLTWVLATNALGAAPSGLLGTWQIDSEANVLARAEADALHMNVGPFGLLWAPDPSVTSRIGDGQFPLTTVAELPVAPYTSSLGGIGHLYSLLFALGITSSLTLMKGFAVLVFALCATAFGSLLWHYSSRALAVGWIASCLFGPWIAFIARNIYWFPSLLLLPAIATSVAIIARRRWQTILALIAVWFAFALKYAMTGYEVATSVTLLAMAVPWLIGKGANNRFRAKAVASGTVGLLSITAFATVLVVHASLRGSSLTSGLRAIWYEDVIRRTVGTNSGESVDLSLVTVLWRYFGDWDTEVLRLHIDRVLSLSLDQRGLVLLTVLAVLSLAWPPASPRSPLIAGAIWGLAIPISWFVLAREHSAVHAHILYFLWYLLYIPALLGAIARATWHFVPRSGETSSRPENR